MKLKLVNPGDPIRAEDYNALVSELQRLQQQFGSRGGAGQFDIMNLLRGARLESLVPCIITAVTPGNAATTPTNAGAVQYSLVARRRPSMSMSAASPYYGRPVRDPLHKIYGAAVGDDCWIVRTPDDEMEGSEFFRGRLLVLSEVRAARLCEGKF